MKLSRHQFLHLAAGAAALPTVSRIAAAQTYPTRPITMIVPFAAGGTTDVIGRVLAARMRDSLKQSVIIENVSGADGSIGTGRAARARPDGYTIDYGFMSNHVLNGVMYSLPYDVLKDFAPISPLVPFSFVLFARPIQQRSATEGRKPAYTTRQSLAGETVSLSSRRRGLLLRASHRTGHAGLASGSLDRLSEWQDKLP